MKKIMILGASILQLPAIEKAIDMGYSVIVADMNPDAIGFSVQGIDKEIISTTDITSVLNAAKKYNIDGIMTLASDIPMRTVATVAKEMNLVGITEETALKTTNKAVMRDALKIHNVPIPSFYRVSNKEEYDGIVKCFTEQIIVKPADNSGSRGIFKVDDLSDVRKLEDAYNYSKQYSRSGDVVVEEFMSGPEVSVETLSINGECIVVQITDKITTGAPHFVEMGHTQPTRLPKNVADEIIEIAKVANKAVGITDGPSHTEIIVTTVGPKIVEIGARLGGDNITTHLVPLSTGVDMVENCIRIALGEKPDVNIEYKKGSAIRYFKQRSGRVQSIDGLEEAKQIPGVKQIDIVHGIGKTVTDIENSTSRMGFVIAQGETADEAETIAEQAVDKIKIKFG